ncbi:AAA family ATPase [Paraliomyxa miuraensis]|uniref:AAA family ATPase n=1 Tax=Paraliomyxa miuraensis TaxID=376150 RepID=UPI002250E2C7|nr:AAA family ATPase [Paraliomyxa miuraensis]MCX4247950.1 AAA family ATPase [Paraliomyxa miuraensis]
MLGHLELTNVGPAPKLEIDFAERLNLITGDNGLGKSFLLDVAWWALTQTWAREMARPPRGVHEASISSRTQGNLRGSTWLPAPTIEWDRRSQGWHPANESEGDARGIVLYALVDGGLAVWDSARNHWLAEQLVEGEELPSFVFNPTEVWQGLTRNGVSLCEGLIRDWASWQKEQGQPFDQLGAVLESLSPSADERLVPGDFTRLGFQARDIPTLRMSYGQDVPVVHASAGMRRIIALAYMLVWTWQEHVKASDLIGEPQSLAHLRGLRPPHGALARGRGRAPASRRPAPRARTRPTQAPRSRRSPPPRAPRRRSVLGPLGLLPRAARGAVIRVEPQPQPYDFDARVRQPGHSALAELIGESLTVQRPGPRRSKKADRIEDLRHDDLPPLWRRCLPQLAEAYRRICAYSCLYVEPFTGTDTVDHYVPKSLDVRLAYEWSNYRFACARMNARKGVAAEVLDPFEIQDGWFRLELVRFQLHPAPGLPAELTARIEATIGLLGLNDEDCKQTRAGWYEDYQAGLFDLPYLDRRFPLLARELRRQDRIPPFAPS